MKTLFLLSVHRTQNKLQTDVLHCVIGKLWQGGAQDVFSSTQSKLTKQT